MKLKNLLEKIKKSNPKADIKLIEKAFEYASNYHKNQKRLSGESYMTHPLNVASILADLNLDTKTISAGLLHDTIEDTSASIQELKKEFGNEITYMVESLTKMKELKYKDRRNAESIRKMILASAKDIRVILIKLADKLHNMRTIKYHKKERQEEISKGVLDIYAPLAYKLGMAKIKFELEDLAFEALHPDIYRKFILKFKKFGKNKIQREFEIRKIKKIIERELKLNDINARIEGRQKHLYSIYKKMILKNRSFEEIYDLLALRIITSSIKDCYDVLRIIHNKWKPIAGEFDDYIAMPKINMYQSLHTAVIMQGHPVEFQIRTKEMDGIAEEGIAAHWKYKGVYGDKNFDRKLSWMKQILEWQRETTNIEDFIESLKVDFFGDEIYVFTPKGKVINLPKGSCAIDFAYQVHSQIGDHCNGAIVNGRITPLRNELKNGDIVKILTSKNARPRRDWLKIVNTVKAKTKIKQSIREHEKIPVASVKTREVRNKSRVKPIILVKGHEKINYKFSKCCHPIPGDKIKAYYVGTKGISIHKNSCKTLRNKKKDRVLNAYWIDFSNVPLKIMIISNDRAGLLADIFNTIAATGTNLNNTKAKPIGNDLIECSFNMIAENLDHVKDVVSRTKRIKNVRKVFISN